LIAKSARAPQDPGEPVGSRDARGPEIPAGSTAPRADAIYPDLAGRTAIVTGGSRGIGLATARKLAANQVNVVIVARTAADLERVVARLRAEGAKAHGYAVDCTDSTALEAMVAEVAGTVGTPDILMAFAGGFTRTTGVLDITETEWRHVIDSNLTSTFLTVRAVLPGMVERRRGAIVTMASNAGRLLDIPLTASYAAAKAGIIQFTRHVAIEVGPSNVRCNVVAPATTLTERVASTLSPEAIDHVTRSAPLRRIGQPEDSAAAAVFLASDAASWLTGITMDVAGGRIMI
jgi:3-oxoacyl-[acyl-carrier protein] reductase